MRSDIPANSRVQALVPGADFHDAWSVQAGNSELSALGQFLKAIALTPAWVNHCMQLRNRVVEKLGLKHKRIAPAVLKAVAQP